ncbi:hypothetical protein ACFL1S_02435 [Pseudomonadota bacterium]
MIGKLSPSWLLTNKLGDIAGPGTTFRISETKLAGRRTTTTAVLVHYFVAIVVNPITANLGLRNAKQLNIRALPGLVHRERDTPRRRDR